ncbi:unnamed protein product [Vicia faba]|uniref:Uncharacterized protein n=1 Tax=Vicia faba TaxID=3906 RepID=A0AAV0ZJW9_VICFA|nr:unnamed protein product [Vicia faba]
MVPPPPEPINCSPPKTALVSPAEKVHQASTSKEKEKEDDADFKPIETLDPKLEGIGHNCDKPKGIVKEYKPKPKTPEDNKTVSSSNIVKAGRDEIIGKDMGGTETTSTTGNEIEKWTEAHKSGKARGK